MRLRNLSIYKWKQGIPMKRRDTFKALLGAVALPIVPAVAKAESYPIVQRLIITDLDTNFYDFTSDFHAQIANSVGVPYEHLGDQLERGEFEAEREHFIARCREILEASDYHPGHA
jgi:hypothetical protein